MGTSLESHPIIEIVWAPNDPTIAFALDSSGSVLKRCDGDDAVEQLNREFGNVYAITFREMLVDEWTEFQKSL